MAKICFVSYEIHPTVSGGCGVFLYNAAHMLLSQGNQIIFLLDLPEKDFHQFNEVDRLNLPNPENCRAYRVEDVARDLKYTGGDFSSTFEYFAYRFHHAASVVNQIERPDIIEFIDYVGASYHALCAKAAGLDYQDTHLAVRLHTSIELIDRQQPGAFHSPDRYVMYNLEHHALRLAETVLYPSRSYLEKAYKPYYESWFGETVLSTPPLADKPVPSGLCEHPNIILFYGRLFGAKGADRFVDAAVLYLSDPENPRREFYLVGYDSNLPPGAKGSYQEYLRCKIPVQYQDAFVFTGKLSWQELGDLLPQVLFAVIPTYFESFCYAAHELYVIGIPLIVSDIPAFEDYFIHEKNALVFDGSVGDLANQMRRLSVDDALRQQIKYPYPVLQDPLGDFYILPDHPSWMEKKPAENLPSLLICILCDSPDKLNDTLQSIRNIPLKQVQIVLAYPQQESGEGQVLTWFLGKLYDFKDEHGRPLYPTQIYTSDSLFILKAGDVLEARFILAGLSTLQNHASVTFVGCWKKILKKTESPVEIIAYDASLELLLLKGKSPFSRSLMRTHSGKLLIDLLDPRAGRLGELAYLWQLDTDACCGVVIPEVLLTQNAENEKILATDEMDFLFIRDDQPWRKKRLARYLLSLPDRSTALASSWPEPRHDITYWVRQGIYWLGATRLNQWLNRRMPWAKEIIRKTNKLLHLYESKAS